MPDLSVLEQRLFTSAKNRFAAGICLRSAAVALGLMSILPDWAAAAPYAVAVVAMAAEFCSIRSDIVKSRADRLLRIRELHDGLGWEPDITAIADILAVTPEKVQTVAPSSSPDAFASHQPIGPERTFENLKESAWWTQQLSLVMLKATAAFVILLVIASFAFLVISAVASFTTPSRLAAARSVTALLVLVFSAGFVKLAVAYYLLYDRAKTAVTRLKMVPNEQELARRLVLLYEYQNARSSGPLIPDSVYSRLRRRLNRLWALQANT